MVARRIRLLIIVAVMAGALIGGLALFGVSSPVYAQDAGPNPFGLSCTPIDQDVRFCGGNGTTDRIPSFDGVLIDADVTLPPTGPGPWPTIVLINGLGGDKTQLQDNTPTPEIPAPRVPPDTTHHNNIWFASRGFATLAISTRGFGQSCGGGGTPAAQLQPPPCDRGFVRVGDTRYEARDAQHLLGLLADQGVATPDRMGATGFSYGGGIATQLGYLKDRIRCPKVPVEGDSPCDSAESGELRPWTSPTGTPLAFGAVYAQWHWSDLIASLLPNGRFLDFDPSTLDSSLEPVGVMAQSYVQALVGLAETAGYIIAPQVPGSTDSEWDLKSIVALLELGEPYPASTVAIAQAFKNFHSGFGISGDAAPMMLETGWNDDLFPPKESLRVYLDLRGKDPDADVVMAIGDYGHSRDANKAGTALVFNDAATAFFDSRLRGVGDGPAPGSVVAMTTTCPALGVAQVPDGGPFRAASWEALHPNDVRFGDAAGQTVTHPGGDPTIGVRFDPIPDVNPAGTADPCTRIDESTAPGTANWTMPVTESFTMMGFPTIRATIATTGINGQLAGRLWDIDEAGTQQLISRGVYRLLDNQSGDVVFQLNGNGWTFEPGHTVKLELAGSDAPQYRASNGAFQVSISDVTVSLPTLAEGVAPTPAPAPLSTETPAAPAPSPAPMPTTAAQSPLPTTGAKGVAALGLLAVVVAVRLRRRRA